MVFQRLYKHMNRWYPLLILVAFVVAVGARVSLDRQTAQNRQYLEEEAKALLDSGLYQDAKIRLESLDPDRENQKIQMYLLDVYMALQQPEVLEYRAKQVLQHFGDAMEVSEKMAVHERIVTAWMQSRAYYNARIAIEVAREDIKRPVFSDRYTSLERQFTLRRIPFSEIRVLGMSEKYLAAKDEDGWTLIDSRMESLFGAKRVDAIIGVVPVSEKKMASLNRVMFLSETTSDRYVLVEKGGRSMYMTLAGDFVRWVTVEEENVAASNQTGSNETPVETAFLFPVQSGALWGIKNADGAIIVDPQFDEILEIDANGSTFVRREDSWYHLTLDAFWSA